MSAEAAGPAAQGEVLHELTIKLYENAIWVSEGMDPVYQLGVLSMAEAVVKQRMLTAKPAAVAAKPRSRVPAWLKGRRK